MEAFVEGHRRRRAASLVLGCVCSVVMCLAAAPAGAVILPATTIDGPSAEIIALGGVAMATDGTGGLVYVKTVAGVPHVFASRYAAGQWGPPIRVDRELPYPASQPAIAISRDTSSVNLTDSLEPYLAPSSVMVEPKPRNPMP